MKQLDKKTFYYTDELNDEFSLNEIKDKTVSPKYVYYSRNPFAKIKHFFWNKIVAFPIAYLNAKIRFKWKLVNKKAFKSIKKTSYFIYGNHTQQFFDAGMAKIISPHEAYVMVNPENLHIKGIGWLVKRLGALPVPSNIEETKKFVKAVDEIVKDKKPILIYPEAHIWPYYTKIRPFVATSFRYPVKYNLPTFTFTNTYQKLKKSNKVQIVTYIDGPFYPNTNLPVKEQIQDLRDRIYNAMVERSKNSNYEVIEYLPKIIKGEDQPEINSNLNN